MNNSRLFLYDIFLTADISMSRLWSTLKSVVGGTAVKEVESLAAAAVSVSPPGAPGDGILSNFSLVKPHVPLIKFRYSIFRPGILSIILFNQEGSGSLGAVSEPDSGVRRNSFLPSATASSSLPSCSCRE